MSGKVASKDPRDAKFARSFAGLPDESEIKSGIARSKLMQNMATGDILAQAREATICYVEIPMQNCTPGSNVRSVRSISRESMHESLVQNGWQEPQVAWVYLEDDEKRKKLIKAANQNEKTAYAAAANGGAPVRLPIAVETDDICDWKVIDGMHRITCLPGLLENQDDAVLDEDARKERYS